MTCIQVSKHSNSMSLCWHAHLEDNGSRVRVLNGQRLRNLNGEWTWSVINNTSIRGPLLFDIRRKLSSVGSISTDISKDFDQEYEQNALRFKYCFGLRNSPTRAMGSGGGDGSSAIKVDSEMDGNDCSRLAQGFDLFRDCGTGSNW